MPARPPRWPVWLDDRLLFPDPAAALDGHPPGLVALGGDLSVARLLLAYQHGLFPWSEQPITWWSPNPRAILELNSLHVGRTLRRILRRTPYQLTVNLAFRAVVEGCAAPNPGRIRSWITPGLVAAYVRLHQAGHAHSVECWSGDRLVGGIYGVALGRLFAGESMFHRADNASKIALVHLVERLRQGGFSLFDLQMLTPITQAMGAIDIPRATYLQRLAEAVLPTAAPDPSAKAGFLARMLHSQHAPSPSLPLPNRSERPRSKGLGSG